MPVSVASPHFGVKDRGCVRDRKTICCLSNRSVLHVFLCVHKPIRPLFMLGLCLRICDGSSIWGPFLCRHYACLFFGFVFIFTMVTDFRYTIQSLNMSAPFLFSTFGVNHTRATFFLFHSFHKKMGILLASRMINFTICFENFFLTIFIAILSFCFVAVDQLYRIVFFWGFTNWDAQSSLVYLTSLFSCFVISPF